VDPLPIAGVTLEVLPFGVDWAFELREIWTLKISDLVELLALVQRLRMAIRISVSPYWSGDSLENPGEPLFGFAVMDDPKVHPVHPRNRPILIVRRSDI